MKVALVQMTVQESKVENLRIAKEYVAESKKNGADFAVLPEMFCCPYQTKNFPIYAEGEDSQFFKELSNIAKENSIYLIAGSIPELFEDKVYNTSYAFDRNGRVIGKHRKVHLFDIDVEGGQAFKESDTLSAGNSETVFETEFGKMGLMICYDFRFPELSRLVVNEDVKAIFVPAAFNMTTGPAHWEILFRTRALDNQVFTIGVAPARDLESSYTSYGHSIVVSPWGDVIKELDEKEGLHVCDVNLEKIEEIRNQLPLLKHRRHDLYKITK